MSCISTAHLTNKSVMNLELEKKKELERRKILRILQVRQQSKDFANKLRENIQEETINLRNKNVEIRRKQIREKQLEELNRLKEIYKTCLQSVGESHREASKQPNFALRNQENEIERTAKAAVRGIEARKQHLKNEAVRQLQIEAPIKQKRKTRNKENLRSFYVSSLPKHTPLPTNSIKPLKQTNLISVPSVIPQVIQEVPSNLLISQPSASQPLIIEEKSENNKEIRRNLEVKQKKPKIVNNVQTDINQGSDFISLKDCSCDYVVCSCHNSPLSLRRCQSESRLSSEGSFEKEIHQPRKVKTRSRSCSPSVKTLNYCDVGNLFESNQRSFVTITHHPTPPKSKGELTILIDLKETDCGKKSNYSKEIKEKTEERSKKALQREHLKKDFQQLLHDLGNLTRRKHILKSRIKTKDRVYQRERDILAKNESKQKKLADAFETLLHTAKSIQSQCPDSLHETTSKSTNGSPPPTLNLALCQEVNMSQLPTIPEENCADRPLNKSPCRSRSPGTICSDRPSNRSPQSSGSPGTRSRSQSPGHSPGRSHFANSLVSVCTEPSGDIHVIVKQPQKGKKHKKKCKKFEIPQLDSSESSYYDPPDQLTPSELELIETLRKMLKKPDLKKDLRKYIEKLLTMRRESIDCLGVQEKTAKQLPGTRKQIEENLAEVSDLSDYLADKIDELAEIYKQNSLSSNQCRQLQSSEHSSSSQRPPCTRICPGEKVGHVQKQLSKPKPITRRIVPGSQSTVSGISSNAHESLGPRGFQTPFGLASNLLPRASEQTPSTCPQGGNRQVSFTTPGPFEVGFLDSTIVRYSERRPESGCVQSKQFTPVNLYRSGAYQTHGLNRPKSSGTLQAQQQIASDLNTPRSQLSPDMRQLKLDTSFDIDSVTDPRNKDKLNELRRKLSKMCSEDYSKVIEIIREDMNKDTNNLLKRVKSNPLEVEEPDDDKTSSSMLPSNSCSRPLPTSENNSHLSSDKINNIYSISLLSQNRQKHRVPLNKTILI
uniref:Uncharacterized protein n=4 Tax=Graphocephala atropunctata TaxID=36148 RepID=A0A1B6MBG8_9HEMI